MGELGEGLCILVYVFFLQILIVCVELDEGLFLEMHVQHFF